MVRPGWQNSLATFCGPATLSTTFSTEDGVWNRNEKRPRKGRKSVKTEVLHQLYFTVTAPQTKRAAQMARGPRSSRIGSINIALRSPKTPFTAIPTRRKGSVNNHTMGYSTRASSAIGQHKKNRMIHKKKAAMATSLRTAKKL
jgi:hypothetical protein